MHALATGARRSLRSSARLLLVVSVAIGCSATARARDVVVYASGADLESANPLVTVHPLARQVQRYALFVTLARYDSALAPKPYYARRWEWSADHASLTLHLEPRLAWHDGVPTTARDVAFTFDAARDRATGSPRATDLAWLDRVEVIDDTTVTMHARAPLPGFPSVLCELPIVPQHRLAAVPLAAMRQASFSTAPVGNGPFRFVSRRAGEGWRFERVAGFPASMGGASKLRGFVVAVVDEPATKFAGLVSGDLDVAGIAPSMAPLVRRDPTLDVVTYPVIFSYALIFNARRTPFDDVRVRRAIATSLDRRRIVQVALAGYATSASGAVPPEHPFALHDASSMAPATAHADSLLDAAGWRRGAEGSRRRDGRALRFTLLTVGSGDNAAEQLVQDDLRQRGIAVEIRQMELGAFLAEARRSPRRFDALLAGIPGDVSLSHLAAMFDGKQRGGALDYADYHDATLDSLFEVARSASTTDSARSAWGAVQRRLADEVPATWLYHSRGVQGISRRLAGVRMDLRGELATLAQWHVSDGGAGR